MSDLISRSELLKEIENWGGCVEALHDYIQNMPTAYSVDKVVEELEEKIADMNFCEYRDAFIDAIEIVKQGDVSDDVCEWKYNNSEYYWESSCEHLHIFMSDGPEENEYKHCPYCGKKIKVIDK